MFDRSELSQQARSQRRRKHHNPHQEEGNITPATFKQCELRVMDLVQVANEYLKNQDDWQKNPQRTEAVKLFLDSFCRIDDNWTIEWKQIISSMKRNLL